eukprot:6473194-Amphidinium_carterae.1
MAFPASETALSWTTVEDVVAFVGLPQGVYSADLAVLGPVTTGSSVSPCYREPFCWHQPLDHARV